MLNKTRKMHFLVFRVPSLLSGQILAIIKGKFDQMTQIVSDQILGNIRIVWISIQIGLNSQP